MNIEVTNQGRVIKGSVFDVNPKYLERALKDYDKQLYLKWNPNKREGLGMWELRRTPNEKTAVFKTDYKGVNFYELDFVENDLVHHVLDLPYLNYKVLTRLREMDAWENKNHISHRDYLAEKKLIQDELKYEAEIKYLVKENKKYFQDLQEYVRSGYNPAWFFTKHNK